MIPMTALEYIRVHQNPYAPGEAFEVEERYLADDLISRNLAKAEAEPKDEPEGTEAEPKDVDIVPLDELHIDELKAMAKDMGISGYSSMRKADLIEKIEDELQG